MLFDKQIDGYDLWFCGTRLFSDKRLEGDLCKTIQIEKLTKQRDQLKSALKEIREAIRTSVNDDSVIPERLNAAIETAKQLTE